MNRMKRLAFSLLALATLAIPMPADAAPTGLSSLKSMAKTGAPADQDKVPGVTVKAEKGSRVEYYTAHTAPGYCLAYTGFGMQLTNISSIRHPGGGWSRPSMRQGGLRLAETVTTVSARQKYNKGGRHDGFTINDAGGGRACGDVAGLASG